MIDEKLPPSGASPPLPGFHILVPVWGAAYCDLFAGVSLPSQLAAGNLPALPHKENCLYHVFTRPEDLQRIETSEAWKILASLMPVRIDLWSEHERTPHETMSACLRRGISHADEHDAASLFFNPDLILSDGTINALVQRVGSGNRVIFTTGIRLLKETVAPEFARHRHSGKIALTPRELAAIAMRNVHPISRQNFWSEQEGTLLPATLFWQVADEGFLARCFHLHPLLVWPERKHVAFDGTVDDDFVSMACPKPEADHVVTDSDELLMCEISDFSRVSETSYRRGSIGDVVDWAESHTDERHRRLATFPIRFHSKPMTEKLWTVAQTESERVIGSVLCRLKQSWWRVLLRSPTRLLRRWVRIAATVSTMQRNRHGESGLRGRIANGYLDFYRGYGALCAGYERFRQQLDVWLFGSPEHPYPWNGRYFTVRQPVSAALSLLPPDRSQALVVAAQADVGRRLACALKQPTVLEWPQPGVAAVTPARECWPYGDGAFRLVVCIGGMEQAPHQDAFLSELARVTSPGGYAIIVVSRPSDQADPAGGSSLETLSRRMPAQFKLERRFGVGGIGSSLAKRFFNWSEYQRRVHRISPVILEIPLLPFLLAARLLTGIVVAANATILDSFDRSESFQTNIAALFVKGDSDRPRQ